MQIVITVKRLLWISCKSFVPLNAVRAADTKPLLSTPLVGQEQKITYGTFSSILSPCHFNFPDNAISRDVLRGSNTERLQLRSCDVTHVSAPAHAVYHSMAACPLMVIRQF